MAGEGEDVSIICARWSSKSARLSPGSIEGRCDSCRRRITVSRQGQQLEPDPGYSKRYVCIRCAQAESPDEHAGPVPGALEELAKQIGPTGAIVAGSEMKRTRLGDFDPRRIDGDA